MYMQDKAFSHNQPCSGTTFAASMPDLFQNGQFANHNSTWPAPKSGKRKRSDDDEHPDIKKIISKPDYKLDFLNSPFTAVHQDHNQQSINLLQPQDINTASPIYLHHSHASISTAPKRRRQQHKTSPRSSPVRCATAPPQLQTTEPPRPDLHRRISSPAISPKTVPISMLMLKACHICHRRPFTRIHLDSYVTCELCRERTCFICVRECGSARCGRRMSEEDIITAEEGAKWRKVCSRCAVEGGVDGEIVRCRECFEVENNMLAEEPDTVKWPQGLQSGYTNGMVGS